MKVILINDYNWEFWWAENVIKSNKIILENKSHNVYLFYWKKSIFSFFSRIFSIFYMIKFLFFIIKNRNLNVIHYHKINLVLSPSLLFIWKIFWIKQVITIHDYWVICPDWWMIDNQNSPCKTWLQYNCLFKNCWKSKSNKNYFKSKLYVIYNLFKNKIHLFVINKFVDKIIFPSKSLLSYWSKIFWNNKVIYLPNFIEIEKNHTLNFENIDDKKFIFVWRISKEKWIEVAIKAFDILVNKEWLKNILFEIIGDWPERNNLENLVKSLWLENNIKFLWKIENQFLQKYYKNSIWLIMPSIWLENNPLVAIEWMKYGKAIIASNVWWFPDLIESEKNWYLFKMWNHIELAEKIKLLYWNKDLSIKMWKYWFEKLKKEFGSEMFYERLIKIYN